MLARIAANRYVPELTCQQRARYRVEPLRVDGNMSQVRLSRLTRLYIRVII
jgi:hypothetical protein